MLYGRRDQGRSASKRLYGLIAADRHYLPTRTPSRQIYSPAMTPTHLAFAIVLTGIMATSVQSQIRPAGEPVMLTDNMDLSLQRPVPSPDGKTIALTGSNFTGLYLIDAEQPSELITLHSQPHSGFNVRWSPDGRHLLTRYSHPQQMGRYFSIRLYDVDGEGYLDLNEPVPHMPATPFFDSHQEQVVLPLGGDVQYFRLPPAKTASSPTNPEPQVQASGDRIIYIDEDNTLRQIQPDTAADLHYLNARLSPDGNYLAYEVYGGNLYVLNNVTGEITDFGVGFFPTWSPDSKYLSFTRNTDDGYRHTYGEIVVASPNRSQEEVIYASSENIPAHPHFCTVQNRIYFDYMGSGTIMYIDLLTN